jgi:broad specificity phosphatase PhoE
MSPKRIFLARHAQSEANHDPLVYSSEPDHLHELTSTGEAQAHEAGARLRGMILDEPYGVFSSPYHRTVRTMEIATDAMGRSAMFRHEDPLLREQDYGPMSSPEASVGHRRERERHGTFFYRFPGGESCADIFDRVSTFLETLHRRFATPDFPPNILIFTHGTAMKCFLMRWYHWSYKTFEALPAHPPNCHIVRMARDGDREEYRLDEPFGGPILQPKPPTASI